MMNKFLKSTVFCVFSMFFGNSTLSARHDWNIIFDIPNTILEADRTAFVKDVMGFSTIAYTLWDWKNPGELEEVMLKTLDLLGAQHGKYISRTPEGRALPQVFCDFLTSKNTADKTLNKALRHVEQLKEEKHFTSTREQELITTLFNVVFNPEKLASHTRPISGATSLVQACANACGREHLFLIANWDKSSFSLLMKAPQTQEILSLFPHNNIYISGLTKKLLPNPAAIEERLKFRKLDQASCIFVSGQPEHVEAAKSLGLQTVTVREKNFAQARADLRTLGVNL